MPSRQQGASTHTSHREREENRRNHDGKQRSRERTVQVSSLQQSTARRPELSSSAVNASSNLRVKNNCREHCFHQQLGPEETKQQCAALGPLRLCCPISTSLCHSHWCLQPSAANFLLLSPVLSTPGAEVMLLGSDSRGCRMDGPQAWHMSRHGTSKWYIQPTVAPMGLKSCFKDGVKVFGASLGQLV